MAAARACGNLRLQQSKRMRNRPLSHFSLLFTEKSVVSTAEMDVPEEQQPAVEEKIPAEQKKKRRSYDVAFKMEVVEYAQAHNKMKAARQFDIHRRCVQTWCKSIEKLEAANAKRMRLAEHEEAPAEALEVSISGITEEGELMAALPVTCASLIHCSDVTSEAADAVALALAAAAVNFYNFTALIF